MYQSSLVTRCTKTLELRLCCETGYALLSVAASDLRDMPPSNNQQGWSWWRITVREVRLMWCSVKQFLFLNSSSPNPSLEDACQKAAAHRLAEYWVLRRRKLFGERAFEASMLPQEAGAVSEDSTTLQEGFTAKRTEGYGAEIINLLSSRSRMYPASLLVIIWYAVLRLCDSGGRGVLLHLVLHPPLSGRLSLTSYFSFFWRKKDTSYLLHIKLCPCRWISRERGVVRIFNLKSFNVYQSLDRRIGCFQNNRPLFEENFQFRWRAEHVCFASNGRGVGSNISSFEACVTRAQRASSDDDLPWSRLGNWFNSRTWRGTHQTCMNGYSKWACRNKRTILRKKRGLPDKNEEEGRTSFPQCRCISCSFFSLFSSRRITSWTACYWAIRQAAKKGENTHS